MRSIKLTTRIEIKLINKNKVLVLKRKCDKCKKIPPPALFKSQLKNGIRQKYVIIEIKKK